MPEKQTPFQDGEMYRAGLPSLGARLLAAANCVRAGTVAADIGCDHGKLAVWLVLTGRAARVIATDLNPMPLARARALVKQTGCEGRVDCRLGDGLAPLKPSEAQDILVAGMSGETMVDILRDVPWLRKKGIRLILVPVTRQADLRAWLWQNGFALQSETLVQEAGRVYSVLCADYSGDVKTPTALELELGLVRGQQGPAAAQYIHNRLVDLRNRLHAPMDRVEKYNLQRLIQEVEQCLP